ncbi:MAG: hypothetical protein ACOX7R_10125 [Acetivibrionales bacterium]
MLKGFINIKLAGVILILSFILFTSCNQNGEEKKTPQPQSLEEQQQADKIPGQLKEIEAAIEKIIKSLDGPAIAIEEGNDGEQSKTQGEGKKEQDKQNEEGGQKKEEEENLKGKEGEQSGQKQNGESGQNKQAEQKPEQKDPWQEITPAINDLHYKWNNYMPMAMKTGANRDLIDNFSDALNNLTATLSEKNRTNTLMASSNLYSYIPDLYALYKSKTSPEIKRVRYFTRNAILNAMESNWEEAANDINSLKSSWSLFKNTVPENQQENASKLDFSIYELEKVITERSQQLTDIKGRVVMSNIEALEKVMEEKA